MLAVMRGQYRALGAGKAWLFRAVLPLGALAVLAHTSAPRAQAGTRSELMAEAANYRRIGMFREAAEALEQSASPSLPEYMGPTETAQALAEAVRLWLALGESAQAARNVERIEQTLLEDARRSSQRWIPYDDRRPDPRFALVAGLRLELGALYGLREPLAFQATYWKQALRSPYVSGSVAHRIRAESALAQTLWRQSCPIPLADGLCVRWRPPRAHAAAATHCDGPWNRMPWPQIQPRDAALRSAALQAARRAFNAYPFELVLSQRRFDSTQPPIGDAAVVDAAGSAALMLADAEYERFWAMAAPEPLLRGDASPEQFRAWLSREHRLFDTLRVRYTDLMDFSDGSASHTATARLFELAARIFQARDFRPERVLYLPACPPMVSRERWNALYRDAYCSGIEEDKPPSEVWDRYGACLQRAERLGVGGEWLTSCERIASQLAPHEYEYRIPSEIYAVAVDIPIQLDRAGIQQPRKAVP